MSSQRKLKAVREIYEKIEQGRNNEKIRIHARRKAQKKGHSIATQKSSKKARSKPVRQKRRVAKKRSSIR